MEGQEVRWWKVYFGVRSISFVQRIATCGQIPNSQHSYLMVFPSRKTSSSPLGTVQPWKWARRLCKCVHSGWQTFMCSQNQKPLMLELLHAGKVHSIFTWGSDPQTFWFQDPITFKFSEDPMGLGRLCLLIFSV